MFKGLRNIARSITPSIPINNNNNDKNANVSKIDGNNNTNSNSSNSSSSSQVSLNISSAYYSVSNSTSVSPGLLSQACRTGVDGDKQNNDEFDFDFSDFDIPDSSLTILNYSAADAPPATVNQNAVHPPINLRTTTIPKITNLFTPPSTESENSASGVKKIFAGKLSSVANGPEISRLRNPSSQIQSQNISYTQMSQPAPSNSQNQSKEAKKYSNNNNNREIIPASKQTASEVFAPNFGNTMPTATSTKLQLRAQLQKFQFQPVPPPVSQQKTNSFPSTVAVGNSIGKAKPNLALQASFQIQQKQQQQQQLQLQLQQNQLKPELSQQSYSNIQLLFQRLDSNSNRPLKQNFLSQSPKSPNRQQKPLMNATANATKLHPSPPLPKPLPTRSVGRVRNHHLLSTNTPAATLSPVTTPTSTTIRTKTAAATAATATVSNGSELFDFEFPEDDDEDAMAMIKMAAEAEDAATTVVGSAGSKLEKLGVRGSGNSSGNDVRKPAMTPIVAVGVSMFMATPKSMGTLEGGVKGKEATHSHSDGVQNRKLFSALQNCSSSSSSSSTGGGGSRGSRGRGSSISIGSRRSVDENHVGGAYSSVSFFSAEAAKAGARSKSIVVKRRRLPGPIGELSDEDDECETPTRGKQSQRRRIDLGNDGRRLSQPFFNTEPLERKNRDSSSISNSHSLGGVATNREHGNSGVTSNKHFDFTKIAWTRMIEAIGGMDIYETYTKTNTVRQATKNNGVTVGEKAKKIRDMIVYVKHVKQTGDSSGTMDASAEFSDPYGSVLGTIHGSVFDIVEGDGGSVGEACVRVGSVLHLQNVSVFCICGGDSGGNLGIGGTDRENTGLSRNSVEDGDADDGGIYLNITVNNVHGVVTSLGDYLCSDNDT
ncbi:hypothetical protein HK100_003687 [Physocladia obscura]|uniref:Uncharacterized protein n=1 Tax=Physocladia obscura TaxID=109957 RepID=A0AAD5T6Q6_9FUNG|nr:hypothetical protein HK100_003687 [Physocladia obscura]